MSYLINIFSENSDQAKLVTTIIAAIIAVAVVLLNQWFNSRRSRKEKLIDKIEEMYAGVIGLRELNRLIYIEFLKGYELARKGNYASGLLKDPDSKIADLSNEYSNKLHSTEMLAGLYFNTTLNCMKKIKESFAELHKQLAIKGGIGSKAKLDKELAKMEETFNELFKELEVIMNSTMH
ncbi:hypothetical protein AAEU29_13170 [Pseudoalteromonas sp. SSM20]|uniref:hypothetical protein n=1 Tax=Pseudoalteromonas sp. SSM20 TaxID=3139394 RepID=UPI003BAD37F3